MRGRGIGGSEPALDWRQLMAFKRTFTDPVAEQREEKFAKHGIDAFHGRAHFRGPQTIEVGDDLLETRLILIATGAVPKRLGIPGEEHLSTSTDFLQLDALPRRVAFIGGGYIAAELSHVAALAGAEVVVLQRHDRILPQFDADLVGWLAAKSAARGIDIRLGAHVEYIERIGSGLRVHFSSRATGSSAIDVDLAVHAAGRVPDLESLDLDAAGITHEKGRLKLNEFLQSTSNPAVYAAGDAASRGLPLTPVASHDAKIVATNMLQGNREHPNYLGVPSVVFNDSATCSRRIARAGGENASAKFPRATSKHRELVYRPAGCRGLRGVQSAGRREDRAHSRRASHRSACR